MSTAAAVPIQLRGGTAAQWTSANPTLLENEFGFETDTGRFKRGDGSTAWTSLAYYLVTGPMFLKSYTVATLPSASSYETAIIYVSDETGGATLAFSDGTNWRRVQDRAIVS